jgi:hypothetical protein
LDISDKLLVVVEEAVKTDQTMYREEEEEEASWSASSPALNHFFEFRHFLESAELAAAAVGDLPATVHPLMGESTDVACWVR